MTDIDARFAVLDRIGVPDLSSVITERASAPEPQGPPMPSPRRRIAIALVAAAVFGVAAVFVWTALRPTSDRDSEPATPTPLFDPFAMFDPGWTELPSPPEDRDLAAMVWTGEELLVWSGRARGREAPLDRDGFGFDPRASRWRRLPAAPFGRAHADGIWTGTEAIFWGGWDDDGFQADGVAYDPAADTWRPIPPSPLEPDAATVVWTGSEMIVFGGGRVSGHEGHEAQGAAYDPTSDTWRRIADAPVGMTLANATWAFGEMYVVGSELDGRNRASTTTALALAYDPDADRWRSLPDPPISPQTSEVELIDGRILAWDPYIPGSAEYLPSFDRWASTGIGDLEAGECYADGVAVDDMAFEWQCGDPVVWSSVTSTWLDVLGGPRQVGDPRYRDHSSGTPVSVGTAVVVDQVETSVDNDGVPILGSSDSPRHLWLWRPSIGGISPGTAATDDDAVHAVESLILAWIADEDPYLTLYSTDVVYEQLGAEAGGYEEFSSGTLSGYRFVERPSAAAVEGGLFELPVELRTSDGPTRTITFLVGRGQPADGGALRLLVIDVRPGGAVSKPEIRSFVTNFLAVRLAGNHDELRGSLSTAALAEWDAVDLGRLVDPDFVRARIEFIHGPLIPDGSYEVGVVLERADGSQQEETLFLSPRRSSNGSRQQLLVIHGARPGLDGL